MLGSLLVQQSLCVKVSEPHSSTGVQGPSGRGAASQRLRVPVLSVPEAWRTLVGLCHQPGWGHRSSPVGHRASHLSPGSVCPKDTNHAKTGGQPPPRAVGLRSWGPCVPKTWLEGVV